LRRGDPEETRTLVLTKSILEDEEEEARTYIQTRSGLRRRDEESKSCNHIDECLREAAKARP
jgi:hypothetical protein